MLYTNFKDTLRTSKHIIMDIKKDIQGQKGIQGYPLNPQKGVPLDSSNNMESFAISLAKKCERLSTALYLVTNFLLDMEPMKYRLRTLSIDLVRDASLARYGTASNEVNVLEALRANISETLSLLELAFIAGLVSEMNFSILKREYVSLRYSADIKKASRESRTDAVLGDTFFDSAESSRVSRLDAASFDSAPRTQLSTNTKHSIGHSKGQSNIKMSDRKAGFQGYLLDPQKGQGYPLDPPKGVPLPTTRTHDVAREARHARILKLIKDNREVSIKDISNYFPELSEKTIQRELVSFTESGVLKKSGERRWSRYSLV